MDGPLPRDYGMCYKEDVMKVLLLWLLGVPISVIILLKLFGIF